MIPSKPTLLLDLDGTLTTLEILPQIASELGMKNELEALTRDAMNGLVPFEDSFRRRVSILSQVPLSRVHEVVNGIPFRTDLLEVAMCWQGRVAVVTSNLDIWVHNRLTSLGLSYFSSRAEIANGIQIAEILDKRSVVRSIEGPTIFVGDGANDTGAVCEATFGVAFSESRPIPAPLLQVADQAFTSEEELCRYLRKF